ncbi:MAG TPA: hypothetical protein VEL75_08315 [Candidatus Methylomirabilis sp.]|nr:hypothetical protein [Candidatus Methylomirabilis sp.]
MKSANKKLILSVGKGKQLEVQNIGYTQSDSTPAGDSLREIRVSTIADNCVGTRDQSFIDALFDNVMVNP